MARFLITYRAGDMPQDPDSIAQVRRAFTRWAAKTGAALADIGAPIRSATTISSDGIHNGAPAGAFMGWSVMMPTAQASAAAFEDGGVAAPAWVLGRVACACARTKQSPGLMPSLAA